MKRKYFFVLMIFIVIFFSGGYSIFHQKEAVFSTLEKRELAYVLPLTKKSWLSESFQTSVEEAIEDHFLNRNLWLKNQSKVEFLLRSIDSKIAFLIFNRDNKKYNVIPINDKISYSEDFKILMRSSYSFDQSNYDSLNLNINKINYLKNKYDGIQFYLYMPLMIHETAYFDRDNISTKYLELLDDLEIPKMILKFESIQEVRDGYFKSDHHWTNKGAFKGYQDIVNLIFDGKIKPKMPIDEITFDNVMFYGSHARKIAYSVDVYDHIAKYIYDIELHDYYINGVENDEYGKLSEYQNGNFDNSQGFDHYNYLYQPREAEIVFKNHDENLDNVLIISDSYSNMIRDVVSKHFNETVFINLGQYNRLYGEFDVEQYLEENDIDKVLFMDVLANYFPNGEMDYFVVKSFSE